MAKFIQVERTTSDRKIYVNVETITMISYGDDNDSSKVELTGERSFIIKGNVDETMAKISATTS